MCNCIKSSFSSKEYKPDNKNMKFEDAKRIDSFGKQPNGSFHGHKNDCLHIYEKDGFAYKVMFLDKDEYNIHFKALVKEYTILRELNHANIIKPISFYCDKKIAYIKFPLLKPLKDKLHLLDKNVIMQKLSNTVEYLISKNILHCDLNINNILLNNDNEPVLIDFADYVDYDKNKDWTLQKNEKMVISCCGCYTYKCWQNLKWEILNA